MPYIFTTLLLVNSSPIPLMSSCLRVFGLTTLRWYSFSSCQRFSIRLISGDSAGVLHQLIPFAFIHAAAYLVYMFRVIIHHQPVTARIQCSTLVGCLAMHACNIRNQVNARDIHAYMYIHMYYNITFKPWLRSILRQQNLL